MALQSPSLGVGSGRQHCTPLHPMVALSWWEDFLLLHRHIGWDICSQRTQPSSGTLDSPRGWLWASLGK